MSVRQSLLAILDQGPCYGYQLRAEFDRRTGGTWPLNVGQIYQTLERLERDGLVEKSRSDREGRAYYEITDAGREAVEAWLSSPVERQAAARDELAIKLAVAATLPRADLSRVVQVQRAATRAALRELTRIREAIAKPETPEDLAHLLIIDAQVFQLQGELLWLDHAEGRLARAVADGIAGPLELNTEVPKRGRPAKVPRA
jgi:DNA-binding PadR family transcriptional regulator